LFFGIKIMDIKALPKVSVIIPAYNAQRFIKRTIMTVLDQTFKDFEIIVVDDASTDRTREIVRDLQSKDKRIKLITLGENTGVAVARTIGCKNARGEYFAFLDSDDVWLSKYLDTWN